MHTTAPENVRLTALYDLWGIDGWWGRLANWAGETHVFTSNAGVRRIELPRWYHGPPAGTDPPQISILDGGPPAARAHLEAALRQLQEYFAGERRDFALALDVQGPAFQQRVWDAVARVPYGEMRTYQDIADELGNSAATRAVGLANGANPLAPVVPCHRIVGSDGRLTGYGPGLPLKRRLLAMEGGMPASDAAADYAAWLAQLPLGALLGGRATKSLCRPTCARARRHADRAARIFIDLAAGTAAGFTPCPICQPAQTALEGIG